MAKPQYPDIPKYKTLERNLRQIVLSQQALIQQLAKAKANPKERQALNAASDQCQLAIKHMREAHHKLYDAFD